MNADPSLSSKVPKSQYSLTGGKVAYLMPVKKETGQKLEMVGDEKNICKVIFCVLLLSWIILYVLSRWLVFLL